MRKADKLEVVIPVGIQQGIGSAVNDNVEVRNDGNNYVLRKFEPHCVFCEAELGLLSFKEMFICQKSFKTTYVTLTRPFPCRFAQMYVRSIDI